MSLATEKNSEKVRNAIYRVAKGVAERDRVSMRDAERKVRELHIKTEKQRAENK
jgi:hypothetical protein